MSHAAILIGASEIRTAESAIQEFARKVPDPLSRNKRRGLGMRLYFAWLVLEFFDKLRFKTRNLF